MYRNGAKDDFYKEWFNFRRENLSGIRIAYKTAAYFLPFPDAVEI